MGVGSIESDGIDTAEDGVVAQVRSWGEESGDVGKGVPAAAKFVIDMEENIECARGVGRLDVGDRGVVDFFVDLQTTVNTIAEVGLVVGVGVPDYGVDADLVLAAAAGANAADVHTPTEYPAIIDFPFVADLDSPRTIEGTTDQLREVVSRSVVVRHVVVVAGVFRSARYGTTVLSCLIISRRYGGLVVFEIANEI